MLYILVAILILLLSVLLIQWVIKVYTALRSSELEIYDPPSKIIHFGKRARLLRLKKKQ